MIDFENVMTAEDAQADLEKIRFMAREISNRASSTKDGLEEMQAFFYEREDISLYACMIIDYVDNANERLQKIIDSRKA